MQYLSEEHQGRAAVSEEIRALMARRRYTQGDVAEALGLSQGAVSRRLSCVVPFTTDELYRLAGVFDVPPATLMPDIRRVLVSPRYLAPQLAA